MLLCILVYILSCNKIPNKYLSLVNEAKRNSIKQKQLISNKKGIINPGFYSINNFRFHLNSSILSKQTKGLSSYAFHETEKVVAIIKSKNLNITQKNSVLSTPSNLIRLYEKIVEEENVAIFKYSTIEPFSIFSDFHFSNFDEVLSDNNIFASIYKPLHSYYGNDIYQKYELHSNCRPFQSATCFCSKFVNYNFPTIKKGTNISILNPKTKYFPLKNNVTKSFETNIGGVFGLFAAVDIKFNENTDLIFSILHAAEAETNVRIILPAGRYTNEDIVLDSPVIPLFEYRFNIFDIEYSVTANVSQSIIIENVTFNSSKKLEFYQRAGFKSQKEFKVDSLMKSQKSSSHSMKYELFKTDINQYDLDFHGEKMDLNILINTGLDVVLKSNYGVQENNFSINCGIEYKREIRTKHNSTICPSPYLLGKSNESGFYTLETKTPFVYKNSQLIPAESLHEQFWFKNNDNSWCLGGNLYANDENQKIGNITSALVTVEWAKYTTEYKNKPSSYYNIIVNVYNLWNGILKTIELPQFQFIDFAQSTNLNIFTHIDGIHNETLLEFSCIDSRNNVEFNNDEHYLINKEFDKEITLKSSKGTSIKFKIKIDLCTPCDFETQTVIENPSSYASSELDLSYGDSVGIIVHENGLPFDVLKTDIIDEFSNKKRNDCVYQIKNVHLIELIFLRCSIAFKTVEITMLKKVNESNTIIFSHLINKENLNDLGQFKGISEIPDLETSLQITFDFFFEESPKISKQFDFSINETISIFDDDLQFVIKLIPSRYPVIFNIENLVKLNSSIIFSHAYTNNNLLYQNNHTIAYVECNKITPSNKYGIFKLQFVLDLETFRTIEEKKILSRGIYALLVMKNLRPICSNIRIDDETYAIEIPKSYLLEFDNNQTQYYPIPFVIKDDSQITPFIQLIDIFLPPLDNDIYCNFDIPMFNNSFSFIHNACVAKDNDVKIVDYLVYEANESNVKIKQYSYPEENLVKNWKLVGFSLELSSGSSKTDSHQLVIKQNKFEIGVKKYYENIYDSSRDFLITCYRCKSIRVVVKNGTTKLYNNSYIIEETNHVFHQKTEINNDYSFYAVCKNDTDRFCEKELRDLNDKKLTLISVPLKESFLCENKYTRKGEIKEFTNYAHFLYNKSIFKYITNMKSTIRKIITFNSYLFIKISARYVGHYMRISAIETNSNINIPFSFNETYFYDIFKIKNSNEIHYDDISGNIFLKGNIEFRKTPIFNINDASTLFGLPDAYNSHFSSIKTDFENMGTKRAYEDNVFNFYQYYNEKDEDYFPLKYPEYNKLFSFINHSINNIIINVQESLDYLYYNFSSERLLNFGSIITFKCSTKKVIKGEIIIPSGLTIIFDGYFDLRELYITTNVNWENNSAGVLSFINVLHLPQVDVDIEKGNGKHNQIIKLIDSGKPKLNLIITKDPSNNNEYLVYNNNIYCVAPASDFINKNEFCIYKKNRASCIYLNNSMESLSDESLKKFSSNSENITFYIAENVTFYEETFRYLFNNNKNSDLSITVKTDNSNIAIDGLIKCPMNVILSFDSSNKLNIKDLRIIKVISLTQIFKSKEIGYIDLMYCNIKSIEVYVEEIPISLKLKRSYNVLLLKNCQNQNVTIINNNYLTKYLNISLDKRFIEGNLYIHMSSEIFYEFSNEFYFYENDTKNYEEIYLFQNKEINKISNYIDQNNDSLTLHFLQDANIDLDLFIYKEIKKIYIKCSFPNTLLAGNIRIPEGTKAYIENFSIDNLTLNVDINISSGISSFYNLSQNIGKPSICIYPHLLPKNIHECVNKEIKIKILQTDKNLSFDISKLYFPMSGGYIIQTAEFIDSLYNVIYTFEEIHIKPGYANQYCLYQNNSSLCLENTRKMDYNEFCLGKFDKGESNYFIFNVTENITLSSTCNINITTKTKRFVSLIGDNYLKGNMDLTGNIELIILSSTVINELQINVNVDINNNEIKVPSIFTYEGAVPESLTVDIPNYSPEFESNLSESRQFLKGACINTSNHIPLPSNKDFRVKPTCSNDNGIFGLKLKSFIQKYKNNHFCFYETSLNKCIFNEQLEYHQPVKYSEIPPLFVEDEYNPSIYFYDSPNIPFDFSFQYASILKYNTATIVNNDNAILHIFIPSGFNILAKGKYIGSSFLYQFDFDDENRIIDCGSLNFNEDLSYVLYIRPIPLNHNTFIFYNNFELNEYEANFSLNVDQQHVKQCSIKYDAKNMETNMKSYLINFISEKISVIFDDFHNYEYITILLSDSETLKLSDFNDNNYIVIQSTTGNTLTFDMSGVDSTTSKKKLFFFIHEMTINFTQEEDIDFKEYNIFFNKCILDPIWKNRITGENLLFDSVSYESFYSKPNKLIAFNGDKIQISQNSIYLRNDKYLIKNIAFIQLNSYNTFYDNFGESINFAGTVSTISIGSVQNNTELSFSNFSQITIISEKVNRIISLYNVKNCIIQSSSKNEFTFLNTIEISENHPTELKTNGKVIVKKLIINRNYSANSIDIIENFEIAENINATIQNGSFNESIMINNNSNLNLESCNSSEKTKIFINGYISMNPRLNLESNNKIKIDSLIINLTDQIDLSKAVLIKGIEKKECSFLKKKQKFDVYNTSSAITKNYKINCINNKEVANTNCLLLERRVSIWKIIKIPVIAICSGIALIAIIITIIIINKKRKKKPDQNSMTTCLIGNDVRI